MVTMTLAVPEDLKVQMDEFKEINWSEVARQAFARKIEDMTFLQRFKADSTLTEKEAIKLGAEVSRAISKRLKR